MSYTPVTIKSLTPLHDGVLVANMNFEERLSTGGIILKRDDGRLEGIRPRWGKIYAVGPEQKELTVGQWVCVAHGRWTRGVDIVDESGEKLTVRRVDVNDLLMVSDEQPTDDTLRDGI